MKIIEKESVPIDYLTSRDFRGFQVTRSYSNHSGLDVTVSMRNGISLELPHIPSTTDTSLIIRDDYFIEVSQFEPLLKFFSRANVEGVDMVTLRDLFYTHVKKTPYNNLRVILDVPITRDELMRYAPMYVVNRDVTITRGGCEDAQTHPFRKKTAIEDYYTKLNEGTGAASFTVDIVDNHSKYRSRYLYVSGRVMRIKPRRDHTREDGCYFKEISYDGVATIKFYPSNEMDAAVGMYRTQEEAISAGDVKMLRSEELETLKHAASLNALELTESQRILKEKENELKLAEIEHKKLLSQIETSNKEMIHKMATEKAAIELEMTKLKAELDREKAKRDDHYEQRSHERKDTTEIWKFISPFIIGVGAAVIALF